MDALKPPAPLFSHPYQDMNYSDPFAMVETLDCFDATIAFEETNHFDCLEEEDFGPIFGMKSTVGGGDPPTRPIPDPFPPLQADHTHMRHKFSDRDFFVVGQTRAVVVPTDSHHVREAVLNALRTTTPSLGALVLGPIKVDVIIYDYYYEGNTLRMIVILLHTLEVFDAFALQQDLLHLLTSARGCFAGTEGYAAWVTKPGFHNYYLKCQRLNVYQSLNKALCGGAKTGRFSASLQNWMSGATRSFFEMAKVDGIPPDYQPFPAHLASQLFAAPRLTGMIGTECTVATCICHNLRAQFQGELGESGVDEVSSPWTVQRALSFIQSGLSADVKQFVAPSIDHIRRTRDRLLEATVDVPHTCIQTTDCVPTSCMDLETHKWDLKQQCSVDRKEVCKLERRHKRNLEVRCKREESVSQTASVVGIDQRAEKPTQSQPTIETVDTDQLAKCQCPEKKRKQKKKKKDTRQQPPTKKVGVDQLAKRQRAEKKKNKKQPPTEKVDIHDSKLETSTSAPVWGTPMRDAYGKQRICMLDPSCKGELVCFWVACCSAANPIVCLRHGRQIVMDSGHAPLSVCPTHSAVSAMALLFTDK